MDSRTCCISFAGITLACVPAQAAAMPAIPIICEKLTTLGGTRFEDDTRPPVGITICSGSYAAKALTKVRPGRRGIQGSG